MAGASNARLMVRHILPNVLPLVFVLTAIDVGTLILVESALSFLGLGISPPTPSWGNMLTNATQDLSRGPWLVYAPGAAIFVTVLCLYLVGDGLRDALDPRLSLRVAVSVVWRQAASNWAAAMCGGRRPRSSWRLGMANAYSCEQFVERGGFAQVALAGARALLTPARIRARARPSASRKQRLQFRLRGLDVAAERDPGQGLAGLLSGCGGRAPNRRCQGSCGSGLPWPGRWSKSPRSCASRMRRRPRSPTGQRPHLAAAGTGRDGRSFLIRVRCGLRLDRLRQHLDQPAELLLRC